MFNILIPISDKGAPWVAHEYIFKKELDGYTLDSWIYAVRGFNVSVSNAAEFEVFEG